MSKGARVPCPRCLGTGAIELTGVYRETLDLLRSQKSELNGAALGRLAGTTGAAMCNRLVRLEMLGLAKSRRNGREWLWRAAK